jgi:hypothetical protein
MGAVSELHPGIALVVSHSIPHQVYTLSVLSEHMSYTYIHITLQRHGLRRLIMDRRQSVIGCKGSKNLHSVWMDGLKERGATVESIDDVLFWR